MRRSLLRPTLAGVFAASTILIGAAIAAVVVTGFFFGLAVALIGGAIGISVALGSGRELQRQARTPGRDEITAVVAGIAVIAVSVPVALLTGGYAWIGIPIGGAAIIWMLYAYSHPDYGLTEPESSHSEPVMTAPADLHPELVETFKSVDVFNDLAEDDLRNLAGLGAIRSVPKGQTLATEGKVGDSVYVVLDGEAEVSANTPEGRQHLQDVGPGDQVPIEALVGEGRVVSTTKAVTDMKVWQVDRNMLEEHFREHEAVGDRVTKRAEMIVAGRKAAISTGSD